MDARTVNKLGGKWLREVRVRLGLSTREVEEISRSMARKKENHEFKVSHNWVTDIENGKFRPGMFKIYVLGAIYKRKYSEVASHFGLQINDLNRDSASLALPQTRLVGDLTEQEEDQVVLPSEFKPGFHFEETNLLARVVEKWEAVPVGLLQHLDLRKSMFGYVGLDDFTLFPIVRPGSLVQIDASQRKIAHKGWKTEYERPIYFTELREGYACSWCEIDRGQLLIIPHPESRREVRRYDYPSQAEIVGRVTAITMWIVGERTAERHSGSKEK